MRLSEIMLLKQKGIIDMDNVIVVNNFEDEEVNSLAEYIEQKNPNIKCEVLPKNDYSPLPQESVETSATRFLYELQKVRDHIIQHRDTLFLYQNFNDFYKNEITEILNKSNPSFLVWYLNYLPTFHPIMYINKRDTEGHYGLINIYGDKPGFVLTESFEKGLEEMDQILKEVQEFDKVNKK